MKAIVSLDEGLLNTCVLFYDILPPEIESSKNQTNPLKCARHNLTKTQNAQNG